MKMAELLFQRKVSVIMGITLSTISGELPDEFFDITERDLRILMSDQKKKL